MKKTITELETERTATKERIEAVEAMLVQLKRRYKLVNRNIQNFNSVENKAIEKFSNLQLKDFFYIKYLFYFIKFQKSAPGKAICLIFDSNSTWERGKEYVMSSRNNVFIELTEKDKII
jgi:hypothetical protein